MPNTVVVSKQIHKSRRQKMASYKGPLDYIDVATRIVEFREKYPTGGFQPWKEPYIAEVKMPDGNIKSFMVYSAAAYRSPDDTLPGVGYAWEPIPGPTNFTRDSELQNAETAAWGRAMVAALAVDTKKGIASSEEVRNRSEKSTDKPIQPTITPEQEALVVEALGQVAEIETIDELRNFYTGAQEAGILHLTVNGKNLNYTISARKKELEA
jgi:hypothetical protein